MQNLQQDENANVIVCFCEGMTVRKLLIAIRHLNLTNRFLIIGSDGWADRQDVVSEYELEAVGSISIRIHSPYVESFDDYYFALNPFGNQRNPWFAEFWEDKFHCKMPPGRVQLTTTASPTLNTEVTIHNKTESSTLASSTYIPYCTGMSLHCCTLNYQQTVAVCRGFDF